MGARFETAFGGEGGVAPGTIRFGDSYRISKHRASHQRLQQVLYHWTQVATQRESSCKEKYQVFQQREHGHSQELYSVANLMLSVACAILTTQTEFNPQRPNLVNAHEQGGLKSPKIIPQKNLDLWSILRDSYYRI